MLFLLVIHCNRNKGAGSKFIIGINGTFHDDGVKNQ
jgi:hypothetical protein